jgi:hypothetical protein
MPFKEMIAVSSAVRVIAVDSYIQVFWQNADLLNVKASSAYTKITILPQKLK